MEYAHIDARNGSLLTHPDSTVPQPWNVKQPVLHLLAVLFVRPEILEACRFPRVSCTATVLHPTTEVQVPRELVVRQPVSNPLYFVAGSADSRYGFTVPLPSRLPEEVVIRLQWRFTDLQQAQAICASGKDAAAVDHVLRLRLRPTERGQAFSNNTFVCPADSNPLNFCGRQPYAVLSADTLPAERLGSVSIKWDPTGKVLLIDEQVEVPGCLPSDIWALAGFGHEQLHDVQQTTSFDPTSSDTLAHRANACMEMPTEVLVNAVWTARVIPYAKDTRYEHCMAASERHPALIRLCEWWNANASDPVHRRARLCAIHVRVRKDGEYWNAYVGEPNIPVENRGGFAPAARIGDVVLVEFFQGQRAATFGEDGCELLDVGGDSWQIIGVSEADMQSGEADEGQYLLEGLAFFPERFPAAWSWLTAGAPNGHAA